MPNTSNLKQIELGFPIKFNVNFPSKSNKDHKKKQFYERYVFYAFQNYKKMFRVLFRLIKICIHIKETLSLEFLFKKNNDFIVSKELYPLVEGVSNINTTTEFLITKLDPNFQLHVNFTFKKMKKQAGYIHINLKDWSEAGSYQEIRKLQNAPGGKAFIEFGFIYFDSGVNSLAKSIESFQVFEREMNEQYKEKISEQNAILGEKLKELMNLKESLSGQKEIYTQISEQFSKVEALIDLEVNQQEKKINQVNHMLKQEQEKEEFLRQLVENSGSEHLMNYMKELNSSEMSMESEPTSQGQNSNDIHTF